MNDKTDIDKAITVGKRRRGLASSNLPRSTRIADVALAAGVSSATVSRTFSKPDIVREDIRKKVIEVATRMGYAPDAAAKALRMGKSHLVGVVIPTLDHAFFARVVNSFQAVMSQAEHGVVVLTSGFDNRSMFDRVRLLIERGADALLVVGSIEDERLLTLLKERRIPTVVTYIYKPSGPFPYVGFDNYMAMRQMVEYLVGLGHRHLVLVAGPTHGNDRQQARVQAFFDVRSENGIPEKWHVIERSYEDAMTEGVESMRVIQAQFPETTAVVCNSDVFAFGVMIEAKRLGLRVPEDISITGHDDQEQAGLIIPGLTTIAVPAREMGHRAAELLLDRLLRHRPLVSLRLDAHMIVRGSTAPPRVRPSSSLNSPAIR
jgi:LacI family transcriptional regulator